MGQVKNKSDSNQEYLKNWDDYSASVKDKRKVLLLPISFGFGAKGELIRERMLAPDVKKLYAKGRTSIPDYMFKLPKELPNPDAVVKDYLKYFRNDSNESPIMPTPLDLVMDRPVLLLFSCLNKNWRFTKKTPFRMFNDPDDHTRNIFRICTMHGDRALMLHNRCRSNPKGLKMDLCVDVHQTIDGKRYKTPIVIDPPVRNGGNWPG